MVVDIIIKIEIINKNLSDLCVDLLYEEFDMLFPTLFGLLILFHNLR